ncbi:unnamed protein product [Caenorhabditis angaria]|uniref:Uncharacterized protein n=1 Tax=Caenorhabditis angaria TaxID=860376 RepID=A0A9P1J1M4_9PELO|nr:unnamed protein product [Caenorhabditis angaria]
MICVPILINVVILTVVTILIFNTHNSIALTVCYLILGVFFIIFVKTIFELCRSPFELPADPTPRRRNDQQDLEENREEEAIEMAERGGANKDEEIEQDKAPETNQQPEEAA